MGIDVYLSWDEMTEADKEARYTGFDIHSGDVGYLREAYHGEPYATMVLVSEEWDTQPREGFDIPNRVLVNRLPDVVAAAKERAMTLYGDSEEEAAEAAKAFEDFVKLHGEMEAKGLNPRITISY